MIHRNIRLQSLAVNRIAGRREIARVGEPEGAIVGQLASFGLHPSPLPLGLIRPGEEGGCQLCNTCNSFACRIHAKSEADVICVRPDTDLDEVAAIMQQKKVRHIPVCDEDGLHGMISIGDLNAFHASSQEAQIHFLSEYIYGRV